MISGAREARVSWLRRLVARAAARELDTFVVPGPEVARVHGIDVEAAGLRVVSTPRHASVLLVVGDVPEGLKRAATVAYAQMPRPKAVLAAGVEEVAPLPTPDVVVEPNQAALAGGVCELRRSFAAGAFDPEATSFEAEEVQFEDDGEGEDHGGHTHHGSGDEEQDDSMEHEEPDPEDRSEMDRYMPVSGEDFMSMVEMTQGMPASGDGLVMEWFEAPYGPLFPGLPGGLNLSFTLDGDSVAEVEVAVEDWTKDLTGPVERFSTSMGRLDPLSPVAYRLLALRAVEDVAGVEVEDHRALTRVGALERERAASHLGWLASIGYMIGDEWLSRRAAKLQLALLGTANADEVERLEAEIEKFVRRVSRTPLLESRLKEIGVLEAGGEAGASGPVARAGGNARDSRMEEPIYKDLLGFEPVVNEGNDTLARLRVRLAEIEQSLTLVRQAGELRNEDRPVGADSSGTGIATIETPRGMARLRVTVEKGAVSTAKLDTPSTRHLKLVESVTVGSEVADALVGVASLDLSPWEVFL